MKEPQRNSVRVLVLGDIARSPRIRNHALSFARNHWRVCFSGYNGAESGEKNNSDDNLTNSFIQETPVCIDWLLPRVLALIFKIIFMAFSLFFHLAWNCREDLIFVQSPPATPTLAVVWFFAVFKRIPVVVDWHNYGYTILEASSGRRSIASRMYKLLELNFASRFLNCNALVQTRHLSVATALSRDLYDQTGIKSIVVRDKPTDDFKPTSIELAHDLFNRLSCTYPELKDNSLSPNQTIFTEKNSASRMYRWRTDRPALVVSGCSWTLDDDFSIMVEALDLYNETVKSLPNIGFHKLFCIVTGRGPMRAQFEQIIAKRDWCHVVVLMPWLEWSDYPLLIGSADLGVSLHRSTSGLDLPMKIVDLFGAEVPVLALTYPALSELVPNRVAGCHFSTPDELASHLKRLLMPKEDFEGPGESLELANYRRNLHNQRASQLSWNEQWVECVLPIALQLISSSVNGKIIP